MYKETRYKMLSEIIKELQEEIEKNGDFELCGIGYDSTHSYIFRDKEYKGREFKTSYYTEVTKTEKEQNIDDLLMEYDNLEVDLSFLDKDDLHYGVVESQLEDIEKELNLLGFYFKED